MGRASVRLPDCLLRLTAGQPIVLASPSVGAPATAYQPAAEQGARAEPELGGWGLTLGQLWTAATLALSAAATALNCGFDVDSWWALKMGQLSVLAGRPITDQALAFTPTLPAAANGQWLGQAILYLLYASFGEVGTTFAAGLLICTALGLTLVTARIAGGTPRSIALGLMLATLLASTNMVVRAQVFSYVLFTLVYLLLHLRRQHPRLPLLCLPLFALWVNLHGAFPMGLIVCASYVVGDLLDGVRAKEGVRTTVRSATGPLFVLIGSFAATWCSPLGPGIYGYLATVAKDPVARQFISEWQAPSLTTPFGLLLVISGLLALITLWRSSRRVSAVELLLLLVFGYFAATSTRTVVWWGLVLAPILARHGAAVRLWSRPGGPRATTPQAAQTHRKLNLALAGLLIGGVALTPLYRSTVLSARQNPDRAALTEAADFLARLPVGSRLYHYQPWTGYLAWRLWPRQQLMVDLRIEAYPLSTWQDYLAVNRGEADWESILERYAIDYLVLDTRYQQRLAELASGSGRWQTIYDDNRSTTILARSR